MPGATLPLSPRPSAVLGSLGAPESRPPHRRGQGRLGELLTSQLPQEHGPLLVPPGVARVMGSRGRECERPMYKGSFSQNGVQTPCSEQKRLLGGTPCPEPRNCPGDIFVGCNSCQVSVASLTSCQDPLEVILFLGPRCFSL